LSLDKRWVIGNRLARYYLKGKIAAKLIGAGLPTEFDAISIGVEGHGPQVAIIPLDESSMEVANHIVKLHNKSIGE
jgi:hypothetical protein